jgi:hypothetical protein
MSGDVKREPQSQQQANVVETIHITVVSKFEQRTLEKYLFVREMLILVQIFQFIECGFPVEHSCFVSGRSRVQFSAYTVY